MTYQAYIESTVNAWTEDLIADQLAALNKKKLRASGRLADITGSIIKGAVADGAMMKLVFADYGRYHDMKNVNWAYDMPVDKLKDWIEKKGLDKFKSKYIQIHGKLPSTDQQLVNKIAWGIKRGHKLKLKRKPWYTKTRSASIRKLYDELLIGLSDIVVDNQKSILHA